MDKLPPGVPFPLSSADSIRSLAAAAIFLPAVLAALAFASTGAAAREPAGPSRSEAGHGALLRFTGPGSARVLLQTVLANDVLASPGRETVVLTEFLTGQKGEKDSVNVVLDVYPSGPLGKDGGGPPPLFTRDYLKEQGGPVAGGELSLVDLDWDGTNEVMVSFHHREAPGQVRVVMDVLHQSGGGLKTVWTGPVRLDTSNPAAGAAAVPEGERERFSREIDFKKTGKTRGGMIVFRKKVFVAAGVPLQPPGEVEEALPMAAAP